MYYLTKQEAMNFQAFILEYLSTGYKTTYLHNFAQGGEDERRVRKYDRDGLYFDADGKSISYYGREVMNRKGEILEHGAWEDELRRVGQKAKRLAEASDVEDYWRHYLTFAHLDNPYYGDGYVVEEAEYRVKVYDTSSGGKDLVCDFKNGIFVMGDWYNKVWAVIHEAVKKVIKRGNPRLFEQDDNGDYLYLEEVVKYVHDIMRICPNVIEFRDRDVIFGGMEKLEYREYQKYGLKIHEKYDEIEIWYNGEPVFHSDKIKDDSDYAWSGRKPDIDTVIFVSLFDPGDWEYILHAVHQAECETGDFVECEAQIARILERRASFNAIFEQWLRGE